jgi:hypothetical protein
VGGLIKMNNNFLKQLQAEAKQQEKISSSRILPSALDPITSFIGENTLLTLAVLSIISAIVVELLNKL